MSNDLRDLFKLMAEEKAKDPKNKILKQVKENAKEDLGSLFAQLRALKTPTEATQIVEDKVIEETKTIVEVVQENPNEKGLPTPIGVVPQDQLQPEIVSSLDKYLSATDDPKPFDPTAKQFKTVNDKIKFLEQWISKIQNTGPGSGAADVITLDHQTTLVTTPTYTIGRKDYYVGVNYAGRVTIALPSIAKSGRYIIIKDESGRCSNFPIIVQGNVDNDPNGFILRVDNGGVQMIYRNGWRIV
jgi:hypothetical protein